MSVQQGISEEDVDRLVDWHLLNALDLPPVPGVQLELKGSTIETLSAHGQKILRALENAQAHAEIYREHAERSAETYRRIAAEARRPDPALNRVAALVDRIGNTVLARRESERTEAHRYTQNVHEKAAAMLERGLEATIARLERELAAAGEAAPQVLAQLRARDAYPESSSARAIA